ncbi:hypothetical protein [Nitrosopumilus ureiphilus]|uniref:Uncharacterized protein n=1 Tax=Nitrosopumilus ureiphilus TaxID=1470067 RepID=A0A7D5R7K1_9ARCH|nr:hypothetical protein [Nitrosopumilus ureiphilus]QLH07218.1 hypothetical protein C5F50_09110 [Nitrosopumilus ureiphilus]
MAKIKIRSGRGTRIIEVDDDATKWAGSDFKKIQAARKEASKDKYVTVGRGTGTIKFGDIPSTKTTSTKGMWVSSGRGTGKRKL